MSGGECLKGLSRGIFQEGGICPGKMFRGEMSGGNCLGVSFQVDMSRVIVDGGI